MERTVERERLAQSIAAENPAAVVKAVRAVVSVAAGRLVCEAYTAHETMIGKLAALAVIAPVLDHAATGQVAADVTAALDRIHGDDLTALVRLHPAGRRWRDFGAAIFDDPDLPEPE